MRSEIKNHFETEKALIGCLLIEPDKLVDISDIINPEDFITKDAIAAYRSIHHLWQAKESVDSISV